MKQYQDLSRRQEEFAVNDWAWLRLHQRSAVGITPAHKNKLGPRYFGPFKIVERVGAVAYRLQLPPHARIHDVFHVSLLKKFHGDPPTEIASLPELLHGRVVPTPESVVRARVNRGTWEVLVQWTGQTAADASWEQLEDFKRHFPSVPLADELFVGEEGNVVDAFVGKKYKRRSQQKSG